MITEVKYRRLLKWLKEQQKINEEKMKVIHSIADMRQWYQGNANAFKHAYNLAKYLGEKK